MAQEPAEDWAAVVDAIRKRMRELKMSTAHLARESGLSETTVRYIGQSLSGHNRSTLVAMAAVLRWRYDYLANIASGEPEKNVRINPPASVLVERALRAEIDPLKEQVRTLQETLAHLARNLTAKNTRRDPAVSTRPEAPVASLPAVDDMDADYSPSTSSSPAGSARESSPARSPAPTRSWPETWQPSTAFPSRSRGPPCACSQPTATWAGPTAFIPTKSPTARRPYCLARDLWGLLSKPAPARL